MPNKKPKKTEESDEYKVLVRRVDRMMDPEHQRSDLEAADSSPKKESSVSELARKVASELKTAPMLAAEPEAKPESESEPEPTPEPAEETPAAPEPEAAEVAAEPEQPEAAAEETPEPQTSPSPDDETTDLENVETDKAVDDIVAHESDTLLAVEDAKTDRKQAAAVAPKSGWKDKLSNVSKRKKALIVLAVLLLVVFAVPFTRYKLLGLVIKKPVNLTIIDSKSLRPVSGAEVRIGGQTVASDAEGAVHAWVGLGNQAVVASKQYYKTSNSSYFVGLSPAAAKVSLVATGRLVPVTVINKVTGKPVAGAEIKALGTTAKTNSKGQASIALPANISKAVGQVSLSGYNTLKANLEITDSVVKANTFALTPAGHVYFLSNAGGSLDVVKSDLDGTSRKVVMKGTGREDLNTTSLLASRDWRYVVLKAKREGAQPALYLIDTSNDKVTEFDNSNSTFNLVGWYDHSFIYELTRNAQANSQAASRQLKSYDADHLQLNQLDQNQAEGTAVEYGYQDFFNFYILDNQIVYNTQWYSFSKSGSYSLAGKTNTIRTVQPNGQNKKDYRTFDAATTGGIQAALYEPRGVYYSVYNNSDGKTSNFKYENQSVKDLDFDPSIFNHTYPTFLLSPSGTQTFWTELRDGKNALLIGDANAANKQVLASLSDYTPYGWYTSNYLLVSKNGSELYIMPSAGKDAAAHPYKITDYYKPAQGYPGYGYGYGGL